MFPMRSIQQTYRRPSVRGSRLADGFAPPGTGAGAGTGTGTGTGTEITIVPEEEIDESLDQPWHVIIYDDPVNLMSYVTMVIQRIFGYPAGTAERMMLEVHTHGKSVVWTGSREHAEHYVQQLQSYQLLAAMKKAG